MSPTDGDFLFTRSKLAMDQDFERQCSNYRGLRVGLSHPSVNAILGIDNDGNPTFFLGPDMILSPQFAEAFRVAQDQLRGELVKKSNLQLGWFTRDALQIEGMYFGPDDDEALLDAITQLSERHIFQLSGVCLEPAQQLSWEGATRVTFTEATY